MRQPLGALAAAVDVLKVRHPEIATMPPIAILKRQLDHVCPLDDLIDRSWVMRGTVTLALQPLDLRSVLQSALETVIE